MPADIPLQSDSEFTSDMVKAVENIAQNVKLGSSEFSTSIESLSKAIDGLKSSLIESINSLKSSANNSGPSSAGAAPRASQGRSTSAQDPAVARAKEEEKRIKAETRALNIKTAQEKAIFNAKKLQLQIEGVNEGKTTRRKKTDADTQQQSIEDVFENVGKGFGDVFAVTKEQVSAMTKSGKKGKKEKPFEMDMGSLATASKAAGPGVDLPKSFIIGASDASNAWKNVFSEITIQSEKNRANQEDISSLMDDIRSMLGDATDQAQALSLEMEAALDPRTYLEQAQDALNSLIPPDVNEFEQLFNDLGAMFEGVIPNPGMNEGIIPDNISVEEPVEPYYSPFVGKEPDLVGPTQEGEARYNQLKEEDKIIKEGVNNFGIVFDAMFGKMGKSVQNVLSTTMSGVNRSFSDNSPIFDSIKSLVGYVASLTPKGVGSSALEGIGSIFGGGGSNGEESGSVFGNMFGGGNSGGDQSGNEDQESDSKKGILDFIKYGFKKKPRKGSIFDTSWLEDIEDAFDDIGRPVSDYLNNLFFGPEKEDEDEEKPAPRGNRNNLSSGGTVGYFAEGTKPKSGMGGIFEGIGSVFSSMFGGGKKKKKKKKSLLNNDENNWDTDTNYENKYKNYRANGGEIDDENTPFKPKGTDTVPAMLTPGEEVVKKSAAEKPENKQVIDAMNKSSGGKVGYFAGGTPGGGKGIVGGLASLALGPVGAAFSVLTGSVKAASDAIGMFGNFVAKNNPAVMEQVNLAMNDLQGAIGRALVPAVQALLPVLRYMGDGVDFIMKMLMPAINPLVSAFKTLAMPLIEMESVVAQFLAPAFEIVAVAVEGFAIMLDPVIQLVSEVVESFTQLLDSFSGGIPITKLMRDGFEILGQVVKILVGVIVSVLGLFMTGMGGILQLAGIIVQGFGYLIKGIGTLLSYIPMMGTLGAVLTEAGSSVAAGGESIVKSGKDLQKKGEDQRDRGIEKMKEGGQNIIGKFTDPNYKMKDNTRYKPGDVTGIGMRKGSSVGAAVRETQSTSISGVGDEIRKQALMAATGSKTQEESLAEIAKGLSKQNLADAVKAGVVAANADNKGGPPIVGGNNPMRRPKPLMAPV